MTASDVKTRWTWLSTYNVLDLASQTISTGGVFFLNSGSLKYSSVFWSRGGCGESQSAWGFVAGVGRTLGFPLTWHLGGLAGVGGLGQLPLTDLMGLTTNQAQGLMVSKKKTLLFRASAQLTLLHICFCLSVGR